MSEETTETNAPAGAAASGEGAGAAANNAENSATAAAADTTAGAALAGTETAPAKDGVTDGLGTDMSAKAPIVQKQAQPVTVSEVAAASPSVPATLGVTLGQSFKARKAALEAEIAGLEGEYKDYVDEAREEIQQEIDAKRIEITELDKQAGTFVGFLEHDMATAWNSIRDFFAGLGKHGL